MPTKPTIMLARSNRLGMRVLHALASPPHNLPAQPTPLIGRDADITAVQGRLRDDDVRLLTLTGPPGTGKTRLAHAVAARVIDDFEDGVWFVGLETVREPDGVIAAIAQPLGVRETAAQPLGEAVTAFLADQQLLLVLDNFEQVLDAGVQVAELLGHCPRLKVLATSRAPLWLRWEHEVPVAPLALPEQGHHHDLDAVARSAAVQLFVQRAQAVAPDFRLTTENVAEVAAICCGLDGLPLAIELAASRGKLVPPHAMRERLEHRLQFLTGGARDLPERHQTLRAAITWSYDLLTPPEQTLFRRLGICAGGWTLEAAEAIAIEAAGGALQPSGAGPTLPVEEGLAALLDHSLVWVETGPSGGPRYRMLETLREYAREQLDANGELTDVQRRHAACFLALAEAAESHLTGPGQMIWLGRLEAEHDNLRAALSWALAHGEADLALRLAGALGRFWNVRGYWSEGRRWLDRALAAGGQAGPDRRALALYAAGVLAWWQGDYCAARALTEASLALRRELGDPHGVAMALNTLGMAAVRQGDYAAARARFAESLAILRGLGDRGRIALALNNLGNVAADQGDDDAARPLYEESLALRRTLQDQQGIAQSLYNLAKVAFRQRDYAAARAYGEESLALRRALGDKHGLALSLHILADVTSRQEGPRAARAAYEQVLSLLAELGDQHDVAACLETLAALDVAAGQPARAARLFGAAEALRETIGAPAVPSYRAEHDRQVAAVRAALSRQAFAAAWAAGRAMTVDQAVASARQPDGGEPLAGERPQLVGEPTAAKRPRSRAASMPAGLTPREVEVLGLIAAGRSNREIATALVLSVRTVERHIDNIYQKIGVQGKAARAAAATYALGHGLLAPEPPPTP